MKSNDPDHADLQALAALLNACDFDKASAAARRLIKKFPAAPMLHFFLGAALTGQDKLDPASHSFKKALALKPDYFDALDRFVIVLLKQNKLSDAIEIYRDVQASHPTNAALLQKLGTLLTQGGKVTEAIDVYRRALALEPEYFEVCINLGVALQRAGRHDDAARHYRKAVALKPNHPAALSNLGNALREINQLEESAAYHRRAIALSPDNIWYMASLALTERALGAPITDTLRRITQISSETLEGAATKIWAALQLGLPEQAFSFRVDELNVMSYGELAALYRRPDLYSRIEKLPVLQGALPKTSAKPLIYAAASGDYADMFAHDLISSALSKSPSCDVHLHLMNPDVYNPTERLAGFPADRLTWSSEKIGACDKTLFSTRRFVRLSQFLQHAQRPVISVDVDAIFNGDIGDALKSLAGHDVVVYRKADEPWAHQIIKAGFLAVQPTPAGKDFIDFLAAYILHFEESKTSRWFVDQLSLLSAVTWFENNVTGISIGMAPENIMSWKTDSPSEGLIWYYKGGQKPARKG